MLKTLDPDRSGSISLDHFLTMAQARSNPPFSMPSPVNTKTTLPEQVQYPPMTSSSSSSFSVSTGPIVPYIDESAADPKVEEFLKILEEYRTKCEVEGNYEEAARATDQLGLLRKQEEMRRIKGVKSRHAAEKSEVGTAHNNQYNEFNQAWDRYLAEYDAMADMYVRQMQERQNEKIKEFQEKLHADLMKRPVKFGRELLEWRAREQLLAKQKKYGEAARIKAVADELERRERAKLDEERLSSFAQKESKLRLQQTNELQALLKRIETRRAEHVKQRELDSKRLLQRNRNVMAVLEARQATEEQKRIAEIRSDLAPPRSAYQRLQPLDTGQHRLRDVGGKGSSTSNSPTNKNNSSNNSNIYEHNSVDSVPSATDEMPSAFSSNAITSTGLGNANTGDGNTSFSAVRSNGSSSSSSATNSINNGRNLVSISAVRSPGNARQMIMKANDNNNNKNTISPYAAAPKDKSSKR